MPTVHFVLAVLTMIIKCKLSRGVFDCVSKGIQFEIRVDEIILKKADETFRKDQKDSILASIRNWSFNVLRAMSVNRSVHHYIPDCNRCDFR